MSGSTHDDDDNDEYGGSSAGRTAALAKIGLGEDDLMKLTTKEINALASDQGLTIEELGELKSQRRRVKNREAAQVRKKDVRH